MGVAILLKIVVVIVAAVKIVIPMEGYVDAK